MCFTGNGSYYMILKPLSHISLFKTHVVLTLEMEKHNIVAYEKNKKIKILHYI